MILALAVVGISLGIAPVPAEAAPVSFLEPFPCGESWRIYSHLNHSQNALDMVPAGKAAQGAAIVASDSGTVVKASDTGNGYGNEIIISHSGGWYTQYAHLSSYNVGSGQYVDRGEFIGRVGNTGNSRGAHLHYEQRTSQNGNRQPITWGTFAAPYPIIDYGQSFTRQSSNCGEPTPPPAPAPPPLAWSASASAVTSGADTRAFWKGNDGNLWNRTSTGGSWGAYAKLADGIQYQPGSAVTANGTPWVFWLGLDNAIWGGSLSGNAFLTVAQPATAVSGPPIVAAVGNAVHLYWRGMDANLWHAYSTDGVNWSTDFIAGGIQGYPAVTVTSDNVMYVFWKGLDNNLWEKHLAGATWYGAYNIAPGILSAPSASSVGQIPHVFYTGEDRNLWHVYNNTSGWVSPEFTAPSLASAPEASSGGSTLFVSWKGPDSQVWLSELNGATWNGAYAGAPGVQSGPIASKTGNPQGTTQVFWADANASMWRRGFSAGAWTSTGADQAAVGLG